MNRTATPLTRAIALLGLLLVLLTMSGSAMSLQAGLWQKIIPLVVLSGGAFLCVQFVSLLTSGASPVGANMVWRLTGALALFASAFCLLVVLIPENMWQVTKAIGANAAPIPEGIPAGVDPRLKDVVDISGPFSPAMLLVVNIVLLAVSYIGAMVEDANPEMEVVR